VLWTVPIKPLYMDEDDPLDDVRLVLSAEGFEECRRFFIVLVDLDSSENFETGLVGVVHEEEGYAIVMLEVAEADVLLVAAEVREANQGRVDHMNEAFGTAAVLHIWPAGLADGRHVEAIAAEEEVLLCRAEDVVTLRRGFFHVLVLTPAAVFLLVFFDARSESQFLEATTHRVLDSGRWTRCPCL